MSAFQKTSTTTTASSVTSVKWISSNIDSPDLMSTEGRMHQHDVQDVFRPVWSTPTNLISIFGRARQGKSFLTNCLSGERETFRVSNEKESCTQGIDLSTKWMPLQDFATLDHAIVPSSAKTASNKLKIGFVDAEGQGDRDVSYDANLICPILLMSKCVIFNWKGDLQKDHILSTLGIMTRAAQNVSSDATTTSKTSSSEKNKKFGHLHIVFRDWQATDTNPMNTYNTLFQMESSTDAMARNQIRRDILEAFTSIDVWLFDAPSDSVKALKTRLTLDQTSDTFRAQLRVFREKLSQQLSQSMSFADVTITGKTMFALVKQVTKTLNEGQSILPSSTYVNMTKEELVQLHKQYEDDLRTLKNKLVQQLQEECDSLSSKLKSKTVSMSTLAFPSAQEMTKRVQKSLQALEYEVYSKLLQGVFGEEILPSSRGLYDEYKQRTLVMQEQVEQDILLQYRHVFAQYVVQQRKHIEEKILVTKEQYTVDVQRSWRSGAEVAAELEQHWTQWKSDLLGRSDESSHEVTDALDILQNYYTLHLVNTIPALYEQQFTQLLKSLNASLEESCVHMKESIPRMAQELLDCEKEGFPRHFLEKALNAEYFAQYEVMKSNVEKVVFSRPQQSSHAKGLIDEKLTEFTAYCGSLKEVMIACHDEMMNTAIAEMVNKAHADIEHALDRIVNHLNNIKRSQDFDNVRKEVDQSLLKVYNDRIASVSGWLLPAALFVSSDQKRGISKEQWEVLEQHEIAKNLHDFMTEFAQQYRDIIEDCYRKTVQLEVERENARLLQEQEAERARLLREQEAEKARLLQIQREQEEAEERARLLAQSIKRESAECKDDEEDDEDMQVDGDYYDYDEEDSAPPSSSSSSSNNKKSLSIEQQKARAKAWAASKLGLSDKKGGPKATKQASPESKENKSVNKGKAKPVASSEEEQKRRAREFAAKMFGKAVLEASDDEGDEEEDVKSSAKPMSKGKAEDVIAQARLAAQKAMEQNQTKIIQAIPPKKKAKK